MFTLLRALRLLTIAIWFGGIIFFAFVVAPVAFQTLPTAHEAGIIVRNTIQILHSIGLICGIIFLAATLTLLSRSATRRSLTAQTILIVLMLATTAASQFVILPRMERDRVNAGGTIETLPTDDVNRIDFERLHPLSERLEGAVLFLGLATILLMAARDTPKATAG